METNFVSWTAELFPQGDSMGVQFSQKIIWIQRTNEIIQVIYISARTSKYHEFFFSQRQQDLHFTDEVSEVHRSFKFIYICIYMCVQTCIYIYIIYGIAILNCRSGLYLTDLGKSQQYSGLGPAHCRCLANCLLDQIFLDQ